MSFTLTTTRSRSVTHTIVTGLSDIGRIRKRNEDSIALFPDLSFVIVDGGELTEEQADRHPFGHILSQCVGLEEAPTVHVLEGTVQADDVYLLCTDGLVGILDDDVIAEHLRVGFAEGSTPEAAQAASSALVAAANDGGG